MTKKSFLKFSPVWAWNPKAENDLITAEAKTMEARLTLVASCRPEEAERINAYLTDLAQLPAASNP